MKQFDNKERTLLVQINIEIEEVVFEFLNMSTTKIAQAILTPWLELKITAQEIKTYTI